MGGNGKSRWKFSLHRKSSSSAKMEKKEPPKEFVCPISGSLMFEPVVIYCGQSFERTFVEVCRDLGFTPTLSDGSRPDFSTVIPNLTLKSAILTWCDKFGKEYPRAPDYSFLQNTVRKLVAEAKEDGSLIRVSERELLKNVTEKPLVTFSHAATELNRRVNHHFYSSSSEESVIANAETATPLHHFTTRPSCYSSPSSTSTSSEIVSDESQNPSLTSSEADEYVAKFKSLEVFEQEQGVISLRKITRTDESARISLCTDRLLLTLRPLLISRYAVVQANAVAALVNMSLEKVHKVKLVRAGVVPQLIDVVKGGFSESQEHAAGAIFSLALEDGNKTAIGVLGALQPLLYALRSESERTRNDSALALYNLSLVQRNRVKLVKLGAVPTLLTMLNAGDPGGRILLVVCNLAFCAKGRSVLLANAVECLVGMLRRKNELESESTREHCVAALYALCNGSLRFKALARQARAAEVLREVVNGGSERAREKAKRILAVLKGRDAEEDEVVNWEALWEGGLSQTPHRVLKTAGAANSTEF